MEKRKRKVALERKAKILEAEISRMSISEDIGTSKEVEDGDGGGLRDDGRRSSRRSRNKRLHRSASRERIIRRKFVEGGAPSVPQETP